MKQSQCDSPSPTGCIAMRSAASDTTRVPSSATPPRRKSRPIFASSVSGPVAPMSSTPAYGSSSAAVSAVLRRAASHCAIASPGHSDAQYVTLSSGQLAVSRADGGEPSSYEKASSVSLAPGGFGVCPPSNQSRVTLAGRSTRSVNACSGLTPGSRSAAPSSAK